MTKSLMVLDYKRLGRQRSEVRRILQILRGERKFVNHPAVRMWRGYEGFLVQYGIAACRVWEMCGYEENLRPYFVALAKEYPDHTPPPWFGKEDFHASHRGNLVRKDPAYYSRFYPDADPSLPYYWPV